MGNRKGKNKGKGRGKKRSRSPKENKIATKVATTGENKGHVVQCPIHPGSFPRRLKDCVQCISAERRLVQQERKEKMK
ncbi:hypothetical protein HAV15_004439 [Penicillium sp. str. |uniref:Uncharacterized protein n=1 Tax=Penicillium solitum TaxID=60172 RepID=A0A1V6R5T9_9EURO|nr:uncharacterized protein PENSOL_c014G04864 [Penicillium solitum]KAF4771588.1 hypothetical protein HAV15_004439 [Penicillium sp. str. \